jgi:hypothetical protein
MRGDGATGFADQGCGARGRGTSRQMGSRRPEARRRSGAPGTRGRDAGEAGLPETVATPRKGHQTISVSGEAVGVS